MSKGGMTKRVYSKFMSVNGGVDQYHDPIKLANNKCQSMSNLFIDGGDVTLMPGRELWGPVFNEPFRGVHEYIDSAGVSRLLVASDGNLYEVDSTTKTSRDTVTDERLHFHTLRDKCFYNGSTTQRKLDGTTSSAVGLDGPDTAPTLAAGAAGVLTGSYAYKVTFVIESGGIRVYESDPSDSSNSVTLSSDKGSLTDVPVSTDARVNARYIYRTFVGGAKWYYAGKISDNTTTTYTDNLADASLGDEVEDTHGVPTAAEFSEGANERLFWLDDDKLYYSEVARTDAYLEYSKILAGVSVRFLTLPNNGKGKGLKRLYNSETGRDDLYVFGEESINILPQGDPNFQLQTVRRNVGLKQQDTIVEWNQSLVFLTNKESVGLVSGGKYVDIAERSIPETLKAAFNQGEYSATLLRDNYYALSIQNNAGKLYGNQTWLCDLRTAREVRNNQADATWFAWDVDAQYFIERENGDILGFDNNARQIYRYRFDLTKFANQDGSKSNISWSMRTKDHFGDSLYVRKQVHNVSIKGKFQRTFYVTPYAGTGNAQSNVEYNPIKTAFVAGTSVMGTPTTEFKVSTEGQFPASTVGNTFSFKFFGSNEDAFFTFTGYQFIYMAFMRGL